ncbi:MAG: HEAT repeat domain-containing protein [Planctomycetota bacterium]
MKHTTFAAAFAALVLAAGAAGAQDEPPRTPQEILEHAHWLEQHEHDLAAAATEFSAAVEAAVAAGEDKVAEAAKDGLSKVRVRLGQEPAPAQDEWPKGLLDTLVASLANGVGTQWGDQCIDDMKLYGDRVVPLMIDWIGRTKEEQVVVGNVHVFANPKLAARVLGKFDTKEAREALVRAYASPDPLFRRMVVENANRLHGELFVLALDDQVESIAQLALGRLLAVRDARYTSVVERYARQGDDDAMTWLCDLAPFTAFRLLSEGVRDERERMNVRRKISGSSYWRTAEPEDVVALIELARANEDEDLVDTLTSCFMNVLVRNETPREVREAYARDAGKLTKPYAALAIRHLPPDLKQVAISAYLAGTKAQLERDASINLMNDLRSLDAVGHAVSVEWYHSVYAAADPRSDWSGGSNLQFAMAAFGQFASTALESGDTQQLIDIVAHLDGVHLERLAGTLAGIAGRIVDDVSMSDLERGSLPRSYATLGAAILAGAEASPSKERPDRTAALMLLWGSGVEGVLDRTLAFDSYGGSDQSIVRQIIWKSLEEDREAVLEKLLVAIAPTTENPYVPCASVVADALMMTSTERAVEHAVAIFGSGASSIIKQWCYRTLCERHDSEAILPTLLELYPQLPPDAFLARRLAFDRFGKYLYEPAIDILGDALRSSNIDLRSAAQSAFEAFRRQREAVEEFEAWRRQGQEQRATVDALVAQLDSSDRAVVVGAVKALGAIRAASALPKLVALLGRNDAELTAAVDDAIARMGE